MSRVLFTLLLIFITKSSIHCSYHYAGCFTNVFFESYFTSSFMEPTLCFRLCDTPVVYLQRTVCRCSGAGLMHSGRQKNELCTIPCTKPVDRSVKTPNTCGGTFTYSAYVQEQFYARHGHLFNYQIHFSACELWKTGGVYETYQVNYNDDATRLSLNRLERCAATCLDQNATTKSIAFNDDSKNCLCIMPLKANKIFERTHYLTVLSNTSCDRYCNNTAEGSKTISQYQCGSLKNPQIWAIYDLNGTCPVNFIFIKELKKCVYSYKNLWNSCTPPSTNFVYNGQVRWNVFLNIIARLQLNDSTVTVEFDESVVIDSAWKCSVSSSSSSSSDVWRSYSAYSRSSWYGSSSNTRYILENGCLRESSYSSYLHRYSNRLCVSDPVNRYSSGDDDDDDDEEGSSTLFAINTQTKFCPSNWFDLNGRCYRISDDRKTIAEARNSCIKASPSSTSNFQEKPRIWLLDGQGNLIGGEELNDSPPGSIVEYISEWQARLGFFLLDTDPDSDSGDIDTTTALHNSFYDESLSSLDTTEAPITPIITSNEAINEFQVIQLKENTTESSAVDSCLLITRTTPEEKEKPFLVSIPSNNCSKPRHVLCESNTLVVQNFQAMCLKKPLTLDLPALISNQLTHELCLSICQELQTKLAIVHINKCYCVNGASPNQLNITTSYQNYTQKTCGKPCPGNSNELCGNDDTIIAFQILDSRRTFTFARTPAEAYPDFAFDSCIRLNTFNQSIFYHFIIADRRNIHPRHCLALCEKHEQKYALLNGGQCLCTNNPMKDEQKEIDILGGQSCLQYCPGNYFYTCGHQQNLTIYSMYLLQPQCRHGFEAAENDQQCVYSHYTSKTPSLLAASNYCQSLGATLAKINEIVEIQDILPDSILHTRLMQQLLGFYKFKFINDTRYYWINRTDDKAVPATISERLLNTCSIKPEIIDPNCIAIQYVQKGDDEQTVHERCIAESSDCSTKSAMPVCVDQHIEKKATLVPPIADDQSTQISMNVSFDYSCNDDTNNEYHLIDDYCYRILFHEVSWKDAKDQCQGDNAILFVPEKSVTLQHIKAFFLRQRSYTSSGFAHVGVFYDQTNRAVLQYDPEDEHQHLVVPDSNAVYDQCEKTFQERYAALMSSSILSVTEKARLTKQPSSQKIGCAYIDLVSATVPSIRCDEIPCNRTASVICQRQPTLHRMILNAKREYVDLPPIGDSTSSTTMSSTSDISLPDASSALVSSTAVLSETSTSVDSPEKITSIGRDYAPIFFVLASAFALLLLAIINIVYNSSSRWEWKRSIFSGGQRRPTNSIYAQLTSANDFDLN